MTINFIKKRGNSIGDGVTLKSRNISDSTNGTTNTTESNVEACRQWTRPRKWLATKRENASSQPSSSWQRHRPSTLSSTTRPYFSTWAAKWRRRVDRMKPGARNHVIEAGIRVFMNTELCHSHTYHQTVPLLTSLLHLSFLFERILMPIFTLYCSLPVVVKSRTNFVFCWRIHYFYTYLYLQLLYTLPLLSHSFQIYNITIQSHHYCHSSDSAIYNRNMKMFKRCLVTALFLEQLVWYGANGLEYVHASWTCAAQ